VATPLQPSPHAICIHALHCTRLPRTSHNEQNPSSPCRTPGCRLSWECHDYRLDPQQHHCQSQRGNSAYGTRYRKFCNNASEMRLACSSLPGKESDRHSADIKQHAATSIALGLSRPRGSQKKLPNSKAWKTPGIPPGTIQASVQDTQHDMLLVSAGPTLRPGCIYE
jgi:hypothetical protein